MTVVEKVPYSVEIRSNIGGWKNGVESKELANDYWGSLHVPGGELDDW